MFNTKTLFILGAGASAPYGYPIGKRLIYNIIEDMEDYIFIPKYQSKKPTPYWNDNDKKRNVLYDFSLCIEELEQIAVYADKSEQGHYEQCSDDGLFRIYYISKSNPANYAHKFFFKTKISQVDIFAELKNALEILDPVSIDAFLRDNPSYALAGKMMILYSLLKRENPLKFNINQSEDNWYSLLLNDLVSECADSPEKLSENKVKFITFNYDVSLDYFLHSRLKKIENFVKRDDKSDSPADSFLNELDIEHVYGQLYSLINSDQYGKYIDISEDNKLPNIQISWAGGTTQQSSSPSLTSLKLIQNFKRFIFSFEQYNNIKTMYDERNNPTERDQIIAKHKEAIQWAEEIIFIGFGFDRDNLNMLGIPDILSEYTQMLPGKTIRYLNYKGMMTSLSFEFENIQNERNAALNSNSRKDKSKTINIIQSTADNISCAYQNDFKKFLFK
ncbi:MULTISPECIES: hypothetical protein [Legionella]|uniref:SIR2-like domain-containing protein n=1 Tax=Legionella waltersii TaxID=66969 RepID=A0A0W1ACS7_9GAMM|nr:MULTISPECIES: hypothetical protein [Legionella]KTD78915.1 hypothetical protein Lwal_1685 [Legionella waltersii]GAN26150.1 hypothetical protein lpymg_01032 [Legionella pneumophila]SNV07205.1 Uncharacterised protein [Legionella waltersii]